MKRKRINLILAIAVSVIAIFLPSLLFNKWVEGIVFFVCHWVIREQFKRQYHHVIPAMCRLITGVVFFFVVSFILPFTLSLLSAIPINYFVGWVGFTKRTADYYEVKYNELKYEIEKSKEFSADNCTEEQLVSRCRELGMKGEQIDLAIEFFIKKTPRKELAEKYFIEADSIKKRKQRMRTKLNNIDKSRR
jgi:predicted membrane protein